MKKTNKIIAILATMSMLIVSIVMLSACGNQPKTIEVGNYTQLVDAIVGDADVIKLSSDIVIEDTLTIDRKVVLDMNGKKISNTADIWNDETNAWSLVSVRKNGDLTIKGDGKFAAKENDCYAVDVMDGGNLVIENGEFVGNVSAVYVYEGHADIKGGKYSIQQLNTNNVESAYGATINLYNQNADENKATASITGGVFANFNPTDKTQNAHDNLVAEGYVAELVEGTTADYRIVKKAN